MFCFKARKLINLEMDGALPARRTRALEEHVARCASCRSYREELATGRRLLHATAAEPSEAFEWTLQLKLNRALQGAAASGSVPWIETAGSPLRWLRSFAFASAAGIALAAALAVWVLPLQPGTAPVGFAHRPAVAAAEVPASPVSSSAGATDRLSLTAEPRMRPFLSNPAGGGTTVSGWSRTQPNLLDRTGWVPTTWGGSLAEEDAAHAALREEIGRLRFTLWQLRAENAHLKSLLDTTDIRYLEQEGERETR
jgi:hypothetical protein